MSYYQTNGFYNKRSFFIFSGLSLKIILSFETIFIIYLFKNIIQTYMIHN